MWSVRGIKNIQEIFIHHYGSLILRIAKNGGLIMKLEDAEIWLRQVVKGGLADPETVEAIKVVIEELQSLQEEKENK